MNTEMSGFLTCNCLQSMKSIISKISNTDKNKHRTLHRKCKKQKCNCLQSMKSIIQWCALENQQSPFYDMKWGHFDSVNSTFKMPLFFWNFDTVLKTFRSFDAKNLGSVD